MVRRVAGVDGNAHRQDSIGRGRDLSMKPPPGLSKIDIAAASFKVFPSDVGSMIPLPHPHAARARSGVPPGEPAKG